jgi:hypothetical protein
MFNDASRLLSPPGKSPGTHCIVGQVGPRAGWVWRSEILLPPPGFEFQIVQPVVICCNTD